MVVGLQINSLLTGIDPDRGVIEVQRLEDAHGLKVLVQAQLHSVGVGTAIREGLFDSGFNQGRIIVPVQLQDADKLSDASATRELLRQVFEELLINRWSV